MAAALPTASEEAREEMIRIILYRADRGEYLTMAHRDNRETRRR